MTDSGVNFLDLVLSNLADSFIHRAECGITSKFVEDTGCSVWKQGSNAPFSNCRRTSVLNNVFKDLNLLYITTFLITLSLN